MLIVERRRSYIRRRGAIMVITLDSNEKLGLSADRNHCVVSLGKTLYYHLASRHPGV